MTAIAEKPARRGRGTRTALRAVRDVAMLPSLKRGLPLTDPMSADEIDEAIAAVGDIGPGGHYLGHPHTLANFQRAFFMPDLFDNTSIEQWQAEGAVEANARAQAYARKMLNAYEEPKLDAGVNEALLAYIAKRESEIPAADALNQEY